MFCDHFRKGKCDQPTPKKMGVNLKTNDPTVEQRDELFKNDCERKSGELKSPK